MTLHLLFPSKPCNVAERNIPKPNQWGINPFNPSQIHNWGKTPVLNQFSNNVEDKGKK